MTRKKPRTTKTIRENYQTAQTVISAQPSGVVDAAVEGASVVACIFGAKMLLDAAHKVEDMLNGSTLGIPNYELLMGAMGGIGIQAGLVIGTDFWNFLGKLGSTTPGFISYFGIPQWFASATSGNTHQEWDSIIDHYVEVPNGFHLELASDGSGYNFVKDVTATPAQVHQAADIMNWKLAVIFGLLGYVTLKYAGSAIVGGVFGMLKPMLAGFALA